MKKLLLLNLLVLGSLGANAQCVAPAAPTPATATPTSVCSNVSGTFTLTATSVGNNIAWYTTSSGGSPFATSASNGTVTVTTPSSTVYYAEAVAGGGTVTTTYSFTGAVQTFTVPAGVDTITLQAWGAQGNSNPMSVAGGLGGYATGKILVNAGDVLNIYVGGGATISTTGGFNGGGAGGNGGCTTAFGGGGGGASDIRLNGMALTDRVIVGGGGGGAAGNRISGCGRGNGGGGGGGYYGGGGGAAWPSASVIVPIGGSQVAGGAGGTSTYATAAPANNGLPGVLGIGGGGGLELTSNQGGAQTGTVGAAGGGNNGGPGTYAGNFSGQSGAGGSGYTGTLLNPSMTFGVRSGNGQVIISYNDACPSATRTPVFVTVNPLPNVTATVTSSTICANTNDTLISSGALTYVWSSGGTNSVEYVSPSATTTYTVTGTDANGCSASNTVTVNVNPAPILTTVASSTTICSMSSDTLSASGAITYVWSSGGTTNVEIVAPTTTTTYYVTGTDSSGCSATDSILVNVNQLPVLTSSADMAICLGDTAMLMTSGAVNYAWSSGGNTAMENVTPTVTTTYFVTGTDSAGCSSTDSVMVTVNALPVVTVSASSTTICSGVMDTLTASGATNYAWSSGGNAATEIVAPNVTTTYYVTGTDSVTGCSAMDSVLVNVNASPDVVASANPATICVGSSTTISAVGANSYVWSTGATTASDLVSPTSNTFYSVVGTAANGCTDSDTVLVTVNALPIVSLNLPDVAACTTDPVIGLAGGSPGGGTWSGTAVSGSNFNPAVAGVGTFPIVYTYIDGNGCSASATQNIVVSPCVGIAETAVSGSISVFPNPASNQLFVSWNTTLAVKQVQLVDATGRVVMTENTTNGNTLELNITELPVGLYNMIIVTDSGNQVTRFIKN
ncbi:MAG: T9SS type A sorting domain-containing protein [Bacteroidia bacterium]